MFSTSAVAIILGELEEQTAREKEAAISEPKALGWLLGAGTASPGFPPRRRTDATPLPAAPPPQSAEKVARRLRAPAGRRGFWVGSDQVLMAGGRRETRDTHGSDFLRDQRD